MTYREPDSARQAETELALAAEQRVELAAAKGREARVKHEVGIEKRLLRERRQGTFARLALWGSSVAGYTAAIAAGAGVPIGVGVGFAALAISGLGVVGVNALRWRHEQAWASAHPFAVRGYVEVLQTRLVVTAITARITLAAIEDTDRELVLDLLGQLDTVDPTVTIDDKTIRIDMLMAGPVKRFLRRVIEKVATPLHEARGVNSVELVASTAESSSPYDLYR